MFASCPHDERYTRHLLRARDKQYGGERHKSSFIFASSVVIGSYLTPLTGAAAAGATPDKAAERLRGSVARQMTEDELASHPHFHARERRGVLLFSLGMFGTRACVSEEVEINQPQAKNYGDPRFSLMKKARCCTAHCFPHMRELPQRCTSFSSDDGAPFPLLLPFRTAGVGSSGVDEKDDDGAQ